MLEDVDSLNDKSSQIYAGKHLGYALLEPLMCFGPQGGGGEGSIPLLALIRDHQFRAKTILQRQLRNPLTPSNNANARLIKFNNDIYSVLLKKEKHMTAKNEQ